LAIWISARLEYVGDLYALRAGPAGREHRCHDGNAPLLPHGLRPDEGRGIDPPDRGNWVEGEVFVYGWWCRGVDIM